MSDEEEHSENESYYPGELEFQKTAIWQKQITNELSREKTKETVKKSLELSRRCKKA